MIKTHIVETTEKYDTNGKLIEKITREETTEDDETRYPVTTTPYVYHPIGATPFSVPEVTCTTIKTDNG